MSERTAPTICVDGHVRFCLGQWLAYVSSGASKEARRARLAEVPVEAREVVRDEVISMGARRRIVSGRA